MAPHARPDALFHALADCDRLGWDIELTCRARERCPYKVVRSSAELAALFAERKWNPGLLQAGQHLRCPKCGARDPSIDYVRRG